MVSFGQLKSIKNHSTKMLAEIFIKYIFKVLCTKIVHKKGATSGNNYIDRWICGGMVQNLDSIL